MENTAAKISVIVPVYNVAPYLERCLESIVNQTYRNLEIILIDDGATDQSAAICEEWLLKDRRISLVHKKNGGQGEARNYGLFLETGDLTGFVDSDDCIAPEMYAHLQQLIELYQADAAECRMMKYYGLSEPIYFEVKDDISVFEGQDIIRAAMDDRYFESTVPNMLIQSSIAKNVMFQTGTIHEDILWPYRIFRECHRAVASSGRLYGYFQREGSTMNTAYSAKRFDGLDALQQRAREIKNDFPELYPLAERAYAGSCMYQYQFLARQQKSEMYKEFMKILHQRFCESDREVFLPETELKYKIWYGMFAIMPGFTSRIRNGLRIGL